MLSTYRMDLHLHTCLSPCGDATMIPPAIVDAATRRGLDVIGIADHNSAENVSAVKAAAGDTGIRVIGGMEVTTGEEAHLLAFFDDDDVLFGFQEWIYDSLEGVNDPDAMGEQWIVDEDGGVVGTCEKLLAGATNRSLQEVVERVHEHDGVVIASHVDRKSFSVVSQLGFVPEGLALDALEVSRHYRGKASEYGGKRYAVVTFSDAHYLDDVGAACTTLTGACATVAEFSLACHGRAGRSVKAEPWRISHFTSWT